MAAIGPAVGQTAPADRVDGSAYEKLELQSPDAALRLFLSAFRDGDYVTAYWILSLPAQKDSEDAVYAFNFSRLVAGRGGQPISTEDMREYMPAMDDREQLDFGFLFSTIMNVAREKGTLPLDLDGLPKDLSAANVPALGVRSETTDGTVQIAVSLKAYPAPVLFRLNQSRLGKWRLSQIIPPGGDETSKPFGLKKP